jgi:hypothetical protein
VGIWTDFRLLGALVLVLLGASSDFVRYFCPVIFANDINSEFLWIVNRMRKVGSGTHEDVLRLELV